MNSFNAVGSKSIDARSAPRRSTQSRSYPPRDRSLNSGQLRTDSSRATSRATKKCAEYTAHTRGTRFYNRGIPDGYGWEGFFGLKPTTELEEATRRYRYDAIFVLDPLDTFEDPDDIVWAKDREIRRVHALIVQGYYDAGYEPVFVAPDSATARLDFICANLRLPKPSRGA
ncbi:hypothetical protein C1701_23545 [Actinoalloteichus sp. AHMU CJ021]|uniref:AAA family ATPase n=1 Tax=Actinoalloteichus TaxID=65496 RepID=UPI0009DFD51B|nr:AAA family ATPase [Actinoalloteichus caeruleus]AUS80824.1 hypothetical protein C1701_23545 [Actinoalloteichus sp. AHMU CJ021]